MEDIMFVMKTGYKGTLVSLQYFIDFAFYK